WIGPYQRLLPQWTYVAEVTGTDGARIAGYLTACPDTSAFERRKALLFTPPLLAQVAFRRFAANDDTRRFVRRLFKREREPSRCFSSRIRSEISARFPAHL